MPKPNTPYEKRIRWTPEEHNMVQHRMLMLYNPEDPSPRKLYDQVVAELLPPDRKRGYDPSYIAKVHKWIRQQKGLPAIPYIKKGTGEPVVASAKELPSPIGPVVQAPTAPSVPSAPAAIVPADLSDPIETLLLTLLERPKVQTRLFQLIEEHYGIRPSDFKEHQTVEMPTLVRRVHLPRILVVGLKGHQITEVKEATKDVFQVSFWNTERSLQELKKMASKSLHAFAHIDHLSHSAEAVLKARSPHYVPVPGGVDAIKAAIIAHSMVKNGDQT